MLHRIEKSKKGERANSEEKNGERRAESREQRAEMPLTSMRCWETRRGCSMGNECVAPLMALELRMCWGNSVRLALLEEDSAHSRDSSPYKRCTRMDISCSRSWTPWKGPLRKTSASDKGSQHSLYTCLMMPLSTFSTFLRPCSRYLWNTVSSQVLYSFLDLRMRAASSREAKSFSLFSVFTTIGEPSMSTLNSGGMMTMGSINNSLSKVPGANIYAAWEEFRIVKL